MTTVIPSTAAAMNYYELLEVDPEARKEDIRKSYRRLVKKFHPDANPGRAKWAASKFRDLKSAYDILIDDEGRRNYDASLRPQPEKENVDARATLRRRPEDSRAQARLILLHLLDEQWDEAMSIYNSMRNKEFDFELRKYLDMRDYLDGEFLLGEALERHGDWRKALRLYENVYLEERDLPLRYFLPIVKERIKEIYCKRVVRQVTPTEAIEIYEKLLAMGFCKKTGAHLHKKISECYFKLHETKKAGAHLKLALEMEPRLKGAQKICQKLGVSWKSRKAS